MVLQAQVTTPPPIQSHQTHYSYSFPSVAKFGVGVVPTNTLSVVSGPAPLIQRPEAGSANSRGSSHGQGLGGGGLPTTAGGLDGLQISGLKAKHAPPGHAKLRGNSRVKQLEMRDQHAPVYS